MKAALKQRILLMVGIFLIFTSAGFSVGNKVEWFWQKAPYIALLLTLAGFMFIRFWFILELAKQRDVILYTLKQQTEKDWYKLLSVREREVMQLIAEGKTNKQIAETLFIALSTVKTHINNIYKILEVKNRREAIEKVEKQKS